MRALPQLLVCHMVMAGGEIPFKLAAPVTFLTLCIFHLLSFAPLTKQKAVLIQIEYN